MTTKQFPTKYIGTDGLKHCQCKTCGRDWLIGRKGGGMVYQAAIRHATACAKKYRVVGAVKLETGDRAQ